MQIFALIIGGHSTFFAMLNSFVHIVMYFYYMIAAMGPQYQKYIWWKKYLTAFQMVSLFDYKLIHTTLISNAYNIWFVISNTKKCNVWFSTNFLNWHKYLEYLFDFGGFVVVRESFFFYVVCVDKHYRKVMAGEFLSSLELRN
jgi:hypothetical protein